MSNHTSDTCNGVRGMAGEEATVYAYLCTASGGDSAFVRRCLQLFADETVADLAHLEAAITQGDAGAVASRAHRLKGACLTIRATQMAATCVELEAWARGDARITAAETLHRLAALLQEVCGTRTAARVRASGGATGPSR
jgi:HPt (histidine-containing phosphotransfer) domain-containing protein